MRRRKPLRAIPPDLMRSLAYQRTMFDKLPGRGALLLRPST